jgi:hypothetical protein
MALPTIFANAVVGAVVEGGMSHNASAKRFAVSIASAVLGLPTASATARKRALHGDRKSATAAFPSVGQCGIASGPVRGVHHFAHGEH